jgi:hypothetical protein
MAGRAMGRAGMQPRVEAWSHLHVEPCEHCIAALDGDVGRCGCGAL